MIIYHRPNGPPTHTYFPPIVSVLIPGFVESGPPAPPASVAESRQHVFAAGMTVWAAGHPSMTLHALGMTIWTVAAGIAAADTDAPVFEGLLGHTGKMMS